MQVKSSLAQLSQHIRGARSSPRAACGDPATPARLRTEPPPGDSAHRGCPVPSPAGISRRFPPSPRCPREVRGIPAPPTRARGSPGALRGRSAPGIKRLLGSSAPYFLADIIHPDRQPPRLLGFLQSFPCFQDFSCINITSNRFLFTAGINLHLLRETLSEFPPVFPRGGLGCPVIYAVSPRGSGMNFPRALRNFRWAERGSEPAVLPPAPQTGRGFYRIGACRERGRAGELGQGTGKGILKGHFGDWKAGS